MEKDNAQHSDAAAVAITMINALRDNDKDVSAAAHPLQDVIFETPNVDADVDFIRHVDVAHIDGPVAKVECTIPFPSNNNRKENWVKFDDEVGETGENSSNKTTYNNNNNRSCDFDRENSTAATVNKLSPLPAPDKKRQQTSVAASAASSPSGITTTRPRTPIESKAIQPEPEQSVLSAPVQRVAVSSSSVPDIAPAILTTESTHVNLNGSGRKQQHHTPQQQHQQQHQIKPKAEAVFMATSSNPHPQTPHHSNNGTSSSTVVTSVPIPVESVPGMRTIELSTGRIREGFANGDVIVTLLPANTKWPWITPAIFRPELVPEELMAQGLTLTVEEYVNAMETLVNDYRFTVYNICYKRILVCWILFAFAVLLTLLFSGLQGVALFSLGVGWLFLNAAAIFFCMWIKLRLSRGLEKCMARVNKQLMKHKILLVLDDRGRISCHKVNLCFMYFDPTQCISFLNDFLEQTDQNGGEAIKAGWESKLDIDVNDIVIQGNNPVRLSRKQAVAQELFLSYLQRWGKDFLRRRLDWTVQEAGVHETPRHLQSSICPCQYEEEILRNKIKTYFKGRQCCGINCIGCWL